jgi:phosphatidylglycerol lysyltransferase
LLFAHVLSVLCFTALLYGMVSILRPVAAKLLSDEKERYVASILTRLYGTNSISYFALSAEKSYFFSASGKSIISYVVQGSVAVVAGDPIGPEEELAATIKQFIAYCHKQDWTTVFWQVRADLAEFYRTFGMRLLKIGEDAVIHTETFTVKGGAMANVRASSKRAEKEGLHVVFYRGQISDAEQLNQVKHISRTWLANKSGSEMGFSMGQFDPHGDEEQIYALAVDATNKVHAFVTFNPIYGRHGWGLDLMRRAESCAPGTMEFLLTRSIEYLKGCGAKMVSLGLAPMSNANREEETFLRTGIDFLTPHFSSLNAGQSLFNFKKKFQPGWESRYLVYSHPLNLPRIGWALYRAHQQDALLMPVLRSKLRHWQETCRRILKQRTMVSLPGATRDVVTGGLHL